MARVKVYQLQPNTKHSKLLKSVHLLPFPFSKSPIPALLPANITVVHLFDTVGVHQLSSIYIG